MIINKYREEENNRNENFDWIKYIFEKDNIEKAKKQVYANKGSAGIDGVIQQAIV